jgi:hypothetical protein
MIGTLLQVSGFSTQFKEFLMWQIDPGMPLIISEARKLNTDNDSSNHLHVISRALLLLRGATGACERLIAQGMATRANLAFWWGPFGEVVGLWDSGNSPIYFYDLWSDIDQALSDVRNWQKSNAGASPSYNKWGADLSRTISILGSCERIVLWGLGI